MGYRVRHRRTDHPGGQRLLVLQPGADDRPQPLGNRVRKLPRRSGRAAHAQALSRDGNVVGTPEAFVPILIIAWYFPPSNTIAAVRLAKLPKFLTHFGQTVRTLNADCVPYPTTLTLHTARPLFSNKGCSYDKSIGITRKLKT